MRLIIQPMGITGQMKGIQHLHSVLPVEFDKGNDSEAMYQALNRTLLVYVGQFVW